MFRQGGLPAAAPDAAVSVSARAVSFPNKFLAMNFSPTVSSAEKAAIPAWAC